MIALSDWWTTPEVQCLRSEMPFLGKLIDSPKSSTELGCFRSETPQNMDESTSCANIDLLRAFGPAESVRLSCAAQESVRSSSCKEATKALQRLRWIA